MKFFSNSLENLQKRNYINRNYGVVVFQTATFNPSSFHRIIELWGLERTFQKSSSLTFRHGQEHLPLETPSALAENTSRDGAFTNSLGNHFQFI